MSEHEATLFTLLAVAVTFPVVGIAKDFLANVMVRNTHTRTKLGVWIVRMFVAMGQTLVLIGVTYGLSVAEAYQWFSPPIWVRWGARLASVCSVLLVLVSTVMLMRTLMPLLSELQGVGPRAQTPRSVGWEILSGLAIVAGAAGTLLLTLMVLVDWI